MVVVVVGRGVVVVVVFGGFGVVVVVVFGVFSVVVVVVFPGFSVVVVVVFPGFSVVVVVAGRGAVEVVDFTVVVVDVDVLVVVGRDVVVVEVPLIVVVVTVGRGTVVVVVVIVPGSGHFTRQDVSAVLQVEPSMKACPEHVLPQAGSSEVAHFALQLASADVTDASHWTRLLAHVDPHSAPLPGAKQLPTADLYGVAQSVSVHAL